MDKDSIEIQLRDIIGFLRDANASIDDDFEKLLIAITNVLKLTSGEKSTLTSLHGSSKELQGYVIDLVSKIRKKSSKSNEHLIEQVNTLLVNMKDISK